MANGPPVYRLLDSLDIPVTKSVWLFDPGARRTTGGGTCDDPDYLKWVLSLKSSGHEIGFHNATDRTSTRARTREALDRFEQLFGHPPRVGADHAGNRESLYAGDRRVAGVRRLAYRAATRLLQPQRPTFSGEDPSSEYFWGDLARERIAYWRRFTFSRTDLLSTGPALYRDPATPYVNAWFDSCHGPRIEPFLDRLRPERLERLVEDGGLCLMYTHFGVDFVDERGAPDPRLVTALERLRSLDGWFAPVSSVLDHLRGQRGVVTLDRRAAARHEYRWIGDRLRARSRFGPSVQTHEAA